MSSFRTELDVHGYIYNDDETKLHNGATSFDGSLSAHYENTIAIRDGEPEILTL